MKKIGIMTLFNNNNFGAALQAYALQCSIRKYSCECEDISYSRALPKMGNKVRVKRRIIAIKNIVLHPISMLRIRKRKGSFKRFIDENIRYSKRNYNKFDIQESVINYDCFICGSDNIWNKDLLDASFFLDFVPDEMKKVAYAPGMSTTQLTDEQKKVMLPLIKRIDYLSCREKIGCELIERNIGKYVFHAMDPTLLLTSEEWATISEESEINFDGNYLFALIYGSSPAKCDFVNSVGSKLNTDVVTVPFATGFYNKNDLKIGTMRIYNAGPIEILRLIKNSQFVITDTFHATVFSILFHKNFVSLRRFKNTKSSKLDQRIDGLLEKVGIEKERIIENLTDIKSAEEILNKEIDYSLVDSRLTEWREGSTKFLIDALTK